jgi:isoquinoline 1-oxidoreductase beta subunit
LDLVNVVTLSHPSEWRIVRKPHQNFDIVTKSIITQANDIDFKRDGLVHAMMRTNPRRGGQLVNYDDTTTKAMRGEQMVLPITGGVAVVADNTWRAVQAANALEIDWGDAPYLGEMGGHWQAFSDSSNADRQDSRQHYDGDVVAAFEGVSMVSLDPIRAFRCPVMIRKL